MIQTEVKKLKKDLIPNSKFRASRNWVQRFMERNNLRIRRWTTVCQRLPKNYEEKLIQFQRFVINLRKKTIIL